MKEKSLETISEKLPRKYKADIVFGTHITKEEFVNKMI